MNDNTCNKDELLKLRLKIDEIDAKLLPLFLERMDICKDVARYKVKTGMKVFDPEREKEILKNKMDATSDPDRKGEVYEFFNSIMTISRICQSGIISSASADTKSVTDDILNLSQNNDFNALLKNGSPLVACFGSRGSYTETAAINFFGSNFQEILKSDFEGVLKTLTQDKDSADFAVVPIENSSTGTIEDVAELISSLGLYIIGEVCVPIEHCLAGSKDATKDKIRHVYSHTQALMQCSAFLESMEGAETHGYTSTAAAAKMIADNNDPTVAAIASESTAKMYGLRIINKGIADNLCNTTRFVIAAKYPVVDKNCDKISLVFTLKHESGQLYQVLGTFARCGLNLLKLESRPIANKPFEYRFYADITGSLLNDNVKNAINEVSAEVQSLKILGCYKEYKKV